MQGLLAGGLVLAGTDSLFDLLDQAVGIAGDPPGAGLDLPAHGAAGIIRGLLGGRYTPDSALTGGRAQGPLFHGAGLHAVLAAVDEAKVTAAELGLSMAELAVRWVLTQPAITSAIVGVKKPEHITGVVKAADGVLPPKLWHQLGNRFNQARTAALAAN